MSWKAAWRGHIEVDVDGLKLPVLGRAELILNKRAAGRPKDLADLAMLGRKPGKRRRPTR